MRTSPLRITDLAVSYRRSRLRGGSELVVDGVNLEVDDSSATALLGESGCGKTTLAKAAAGLLPIDRGRVEVLGESFLDLAAAPQRRLRHRYQLAFQHPLAALNPWLPIQAVIDESTRLHGTSQDHADKLVLRLGLGHRLDSMPDGLSGGEQRRVGLLRILLADPDVVIADEPTAELDAALRVDIVDLLMERLRPGRGLLLITHDVALAQYACRRIYVMLGGRIIEDVPTKLLGRVKHHPYTQDLLLAAGHTGLDAGERTFTARTSAGPAVKGGCPYADSCDIATTRCRTERPALTDQGPLHQVACFAFSGPARGTP